MDALNGCLCGQVLDNLTDGVLKSMGKFSIYITIYNMTYRLNSITFNVLILSGDLVFGCARLAKHLLEAVEQWG